jgi:hypothetical protein
MINEEEEFKNALNNKLNQKQFEFSEADWQNARAILAQSPEYKKRIPFLYFTLSGLLLVVSVICFFALKNNNYTDLPTLSASKALNFNPKNISIKHKINNNTNKTRQH